MSTLQIVNRVLAKDLCHWQFYEFFFWGGGLDSQYSDFVVQYTILCLCRCDILKLLFYHILKKLWNSWQKRAYMYKIDKPPVEKFCYMVNITYHLNMLNRNLKGKRNSAVLQLEAQIYMNRSSLCLRERETDRGTLVHFNPLKLYRHLNNGDVMSKLHAMTSWDCRIRLLKHFISSERRRTLKPFLIKPFGPDI